MNDKDPLKKTPGFLKIIHADIIGSWPGQNLQGNGEVFIEALSWTARGLGLALTLYGLYVVRAEVELGAKLLLLVLSHFLGAMTSGFMV